MMIAKKPNVLLGTILAMFLIMAFVSGCTYTGKSHETITALNDEELSYFNGDEFFNGEYLNIRNQFLSSTYERPEKIDMLQLFYCGSGIEEFSTEEERAAVFAYNKWDMEPDCACMKIRPFQHGVGAWKIYWTDFSGYRQNRAGEFYLPGGI
jgi:hypothetical protein